jgi:hypothetical protein
VRLGGETKRAVDDNARGLSMSRRNRLSSAAALVRIASVALLAINSLAAKELPAPIAAPAVADAFTITVQLRTNCFHSGDEIQAHIRLVNLSARTQIRKVKGS